MIKNKETSASVVEWERSVRIYEGAINARGGEDSMQGTITPE